MEFNVDTAWERGRRIVDVFHLANQMDCTQCKGLLDLRRTRRETRVGLASVLDILCSCGKVNRVDTDRKVKTEDEVDDYLVNTLISSSKYLLKMAPADFQNFLDMFCIPVTLPFNAVTNSSTPSPAAASVTPSDISDTPTVTVKREDTHCDGDMTTSDSASDVPVSFSVTVSEVPVGVSASGKMVPAQPVVRKKYKKMDKSGSKRKHLKKRSAQDVPLEEMIQTFTVAAANDEPGGSQSDSTSHEKRFQCRACDEEFRSELEAYSHVGRHTGSPYLRCFRCGMEFKGKLRSCNINNLEVHLNKSDGVRPYVCEVCTKTYQSSRQLRQHMSEVHNYIRGAPAPQDSSLSCQECSFRTHSQARLTIHRRNHTKQQELTCNICGLILGEPASLKTHMKRRHAEGADENTFACELCEKRFRIRNDLVRHLRVHSKEDSAMQSGDSGSDPRHHSNHQHMSLSESAENSVESSENEAAERGESIMDTQNNDRDRDPVVKNEDNHCNGDMTTSVSDMMTSDRVSDIQVVAGDSDVPVTVSVIGKTVPAQSVVRKQCEKMDKSGSKQKYSRKRFARDVPLEEMIQTCPVAAASDEPGGSQSDSCKKQFQCRECDKRFTLELEAYCHVRRHTRSVHLRCFRCGVEFKSKTRTTNVYNLEVHLNQHDGVRPYVCELCAKTFQSSRQYSQHKKEVHNYVHGAPPSQDSSLSCEQCSFKTHSQVRLKVHRKIHTTQREHICDVCGTILSCRVNLKHHKERMHDKRADEYRFACELCEKRYRVSEDLWKHQSEHKKGDVRAYQCQFCPKAFKTKTHLNIHERIHTGKKPYQCQLCDAAFVQNTSLKWHMKKHGVVK
ncbi:zinc finger protein 420-like [Littorina saxatilis]|uniref:zinc finger protein 420-like n=1 Tax=Littorina saxatilis TaxID=31220 RepID=UPI0038B520D1